MNTLQLKKFSIFLFENYYSDRTVALYLKDLKGFNPPISCSIDELFVCSVEYLNSNQTKLSKSKFDNLRAALNLYFLMETNLSVKKYQETITVSKSDFITELTNDFYQYSINYKKITNNSAISESHHVFEFLNNLSISNADDLRTLSIYDVRDYISKHMNNLKPSSKGRYITSIRNFFRFLKYKDISIDRAITELPLTIANWNNKLPITLTEDEEYKLRNFYKNNNERDVRNKLIILLQLDLGLRASEIPKLELKNIHWSSASILVTNTKNNHNREIPFTCEIGKLLENYILHFRGESKNPTLFLSLNPRGKDQDIDTENVRRVVRFAMKKEGISGYWKGTHSLRRTAASKLYNSKVGLKVTADILGHESLDSTAYYVKIDFESMKSIRTPWPGGVLNA